jgi:hypothetical protein
MRLRRDSLIDVRLPSQIFAVSRRNERFLRHDEVVLASRGSMRTFSHLQPDTRERADSPSYISPNHRCKGQLSRKPPLQGPR